MNSPNQSFGLEALLFIVLVCAGLVYFAPQESMAVAQDVMRAIVNHLPLITYHISD
ncbi:hypothetical protein ACFSHT_19955 [Paraburkholderia silviterrae]|uniref:hypothetical protein n=1 Tax=Paraburkholderia silviterrae TaxID=2528715 RepID=UPI0014048F88|nr:hypothetical protein [Paraburkholderia silviterrae]